MEFGATEPVITTTDRGARAVHRPMCSRPRRSSRIPKASFPLLNRRRDTGGYREAERQHTGQEKTILFNLSGHGFFDMAATAYQSGLAKDITFSDEKLARDLPISRNLNRPEKPGAVKARVAECRISIGFIEY